MKKETKNVAELVLENVGLGLNKKLSFGYCFYVAELVLENVGLGQKNEKLCNTVKFDVAELVLENVGLGLKRRGKQNISMASCRACS